MRRVGHIASIGQEMHTKLWSENLKGRGHSEDLDVNGKILERILGRQVGKVWTGHIWLRIRTRDKVL
jgi:hypothetical protein